MKQALVIVNFGTSVPSAQEDIAQVEQTLVSVMPDADCYRATTSPTIRRIFKRRGQQAHSLEEVLEQLIPMGYERVIVQPTHLLYGIEYDKIRSAVLPYAGQFETLLLGKPLLSGTDDLMFLAECLKEAFAPGEEALVLMGHGTEHFANAVYPAFQTALRLLDYPGSYVGTVEGWPTLDQVILQLKADQKKKVLLMPMMLVAGDHACNDMAGNDPDSWKSRLEAEGFEVRCHMRGLGNLPRIQSLYRRHLQDLISNEIHPPRE